MPYQTKDFLKFSVIMVIIFCGFHTTFALLARDRFSANEILWIMINVSSSGSPALLVKEWSH